MVRVGKLYLRPDSFQILRRDRAFNRRSRPDIHKDRRMDHPVHRLKICPLRTALFCNNFINSHLFSPLRHFKETIFWRKCSLYIPPFTRFRVPSIRKKHIQFKKFRNLSSRRQKNRKIPDACLLMGYKLSRNQMSSARYLAFLPKNQIRYLFILFLEFANLPSVVFAESLSYNPLR